MAWILFGALLLSAAFFLMILRQVLRSEERLRKLVLHTESRISKRYHAKLVPPADLGTPE
ncbi:MAG TPA: hypothetical protein VN931_10165 [Fibrobacteria bacterium]|nr:hypothetical protein [Fibrobacteria bacterium]